MTRTKTTLLAVLLISLSFQSIYADISIRSWQMSTKNGLSNNFIRQIHQDAYGFIWIGTHNGLHRFDGNNIKLYQPNLKDSLTLSDHRIEKIIEDGKGYLWVGTSNGHISCFDIKRERFVKFANDQLSNETYTHIFIDSKQDVWLWNVWENGCLHIHVENEIFTSRKYDYQSQKLHSNRVTMLKEDKNGTIWIGTRQGLTTIKDGKPQLVKGKYNLVKIYFYDDETYFVTRDGAIVRYSERENALIEIVRVSSINNKYISTALQRENQCWIFTNDHTFIFDFETKEIRTSPDITIPFALTFTDNKGNYWVYNGTGDVWFFPKRTSKTVRKFSFMAPEILKSIDKERYFVWQDSRGLFWITTYGNGLFIYNSKTEELHHYTANQIDNIFDSNFLYTIMEDSNRNIWLGSEYGGLYHLSVMDRGFSKIKPDKTSNNFFTNQIKAIIPSKEHHYWVSNGNSELLLYNNTFDQYTNKGNFPSNIQTIQYDTNGTLFLGSNGSGIRIGENWYTEQNPTNELTKIGYIAFLPQSNKMNQTSHSPNSNYISTLHCDIQGRMWGGTWGRGLILIEKKEGKYVFQSFLHNEDINTRQVHTICEDKAGWIWVGTMSGLYKFYPDSLLANPQNFHLFTKKNSTLRDDDVIAIYEDYKGKIWIGTSGSGVCVHTPLSEPDKLNLTYYDSTNGLSSNEICAFIEDNENRLWISTENGLTCYTPSTKTFDKFYLSSTPKGDMYTNAVCKGANGQLLFGTNDGIISIYPNEILNKQTSRKPLFTALFVNGIDIKPGSSSKIISESITYNDHITLAFNQNTFTLQFSNCDFFEPGESYYSYMLDGYDHTWSKSSNLNQASYKNLPPGQYTLKVRAANSSGIWSSEEGLMNITITPPIWKTPFAYLIYILTLIILIYAVFRITHKFISLRQQLQVEGKLTEFKLQFFTNIAHEFRTPLTLIQGGIEAIDKIPSMAETSQKPLNSIRNNSKRLMQLIDQLLMFRKIQRNKLVLALEEANVISFTKDIFLSFHESATAKNIIYQFIAFENDYNMYIDRSFLDKILYNLLSNAFKFTPDGGNISLNISTDEKNNMLIIQVKDTGIGIPKDKQPELFTRFARINPSNNSFGIGLHLTHELVLAHHGQIKYTNNGEQGSIFSVSLPLSKDTYQEEDFVTSPIVEKNKTVLNSSNAVETEEMPAVSAPLNDVKLLIIEDEEEIREYIQNLMANYFITSTALDGEDGMNKLKSFQPDIILCDVRMPNMTGYEFTHQIKKDKTTSHIPVILLTSMADDEDRLKGYECGADAYITKPFSVRLLLARIINLLEQRIELKEKFSNEGMKSTKLMLFSNDKDKKFLDRMNVVLEHNLADKDFDVETFAMTMGYKRTLFFKKVNEITGKTPHEVLRDAWLKKAAELLLDDRLNVAEVAYQVGFTEPAYFGKCFKAYFGIAPSHFQNGKTKT